MSEESDRHDDQVNVLGDSESGAHASDGGIPLDTFWARIDPIDA